MHVETCGILHGNKTAPHDDDGCVLPVFHEGPHEFVDRNGEVWRWETDLACDCDWCRKAEGDYCTVLWRKAEDARIAAANAEYASWFPIRRHGVGLDVPTELWTLFNYEPEGAFFQGMFTSKAKAEAFRDGMLAAERTEHGQLQQQLREAAANETQHVDGIDAPFESRLDLRIQPGNLDPAPPADGVGSGEGGKAE